MIKNMKMLLFLGFVLVSVVLATIGLMFIPGTQDHDVEIYCDAVIANRPEHPVYIYIEIDNYSPSKLELYNVYLNNKPLNITDSIESSDALILLVPISYEYYGKTITVRIETSKKIYVTSFSLPSKIIIINTTTP